MEGITGRTVYKYVEELEENIEQITHILKTNRKDMVDKIENITEELKEKEREIES